MLKSVGQSLAPGFYCRNETKVPILVVLSQLSPLHWLKIEPGETGHLKCGRVFFTVCVEPWVEGKEPTRTEVVARLATVVASTVVFGGLGFAVAGLANGVTSIRYHGVRKTGIYANGRTMVITEKKNAATGAMELFIFSLESAVDHSKDAVEPPIVDDTLHDGNYTSDYISHHDHAHDRQEDITADII